MIKLEMTVDHDTTTLQDLKCALAYSDAYLAISEIKSLMRTARKYGVVLNTALSEEQISIAEMLEDEVHKICKDLPEIG